MALTVIAMGRLVDMPQAMKHTIVHMSPRSMVGFRPMRSDAHPQATAVVLWDIEKTAAVSPAHLATSSLATPKLFIISGR